jgi:SAM-dependent methyltransferase
VLEHVFNPDEFLAEIHRILKPEGTLLLTVPFVWDEHKQPIDYARYSSFGLKHMLQKQGFEIVSHIKTSTDVSVIFQLINAYLFKILQTKNPYFNLILTILLMAPFNIIGIILAKVLPNNQDLYLDNIVLARKKT